MASERPRPAGATAARWSARILSLAVLGFIGLFLVGEGFTPWTLAPRELLLSLCFPFGLAVGLGLGWKLELAGGAIVLASILGFYALERFRCGPVFAFLAVPGALFILAHALTAAADRNG